MLQIVGPAGEEDEDLRAAKGHAGKGFKAVVELGDYEGHGPLPTPPLALICKFVGKSLFD